MKIMFCIDFFFINYCFDNVITLENIRFYLLTVDCWRLFGADQAKLVDHLNLIDLLISVIYLSSFVNY